MAFTVTTWNLQGSHGADIEAIARYVTDVGSDVVAFQEVQRNQAQEIARMLDARSLRWGFKHRPVAVKAEGMALIGVTRPVSAVRIRALTARWQPWSWRRRIYQRGTVKLPDAQLAVTLVNLHLTPHPDRGERRRRELSTLLEALRRYREHLVVTGDYNAPPDGDLFEQMDRAGLSSAGGGVTNWLGRPSDRPPSQQLDYVYTSQDLHVDEVVLPQHGDEGFELFPLLSDHLPLSVRLKPDQDPSN